MFVEASARTTQPWGLLPQVAQHQSAPLPPHSTVTALHGTVRHGTAPLCMALHYTALYCTVPIRHGTAPQRTVRDGTAQHGTVRHGTAMYSFILTRFSSFLLYFRFMPSSQSAWLVLRCQQQQCTTINGVLAYC